jgi:FixJ family two-component response regulator
VSLPPPSFSSDLPADLPSPRVFVVDDDTSFRQSLLRLLESHGLEGHGYDSATAFLAQAVTYPAGCIVLDVHMPGNSGLDLQAELEKWDCALPVVFLTGRGDIPMSVRAMKAGATDFLTKPVDEEILLTAVHKALERNRGIVAERHRREAVRLRVRLLTEREHEVMCHVITGALNKQIAAKLGIAEKTVKIHRGRVMEKMGVVSVAELVQACAVAGIVSTPVGG